MALLSDEEADEIRRDVEAGIHGPILRKWIRLLLEDRRERVARAQETPPEPGEDAGDPGHSA